MKSFRMTPALSYRMFCGLLVVSLLVWWQAIAATLALALGQEAYTHILLILPISVCLIVSEWRRRKWKPLPSMGAGVAILISAAMIGIAGLRWGRVDIFTGDVRLAIEMLALVTWWIGSFVACFGARVFRGCAFPLFFLLWLIPMPELVLDQIVSLLQQGTAAFARVLLVAVGVPVTQDGLTLTVPGLAVEVAQECSSIRSSMVLVVSSMVLAYLLVRSWWGRSVVMLASIPLAVAKNGLRVFTLAVLGAYVDPRILDSPLHRQGGVLFLAVALAAEFGLIWIIGRLERNGAPPVTLQQVPQATASEGMS